MLTRRDMLVSTMPGLGVAALGIPWVSANEWRNEFATLNFGLVAVRTRPTASHGTRHLCLLGAPSASAHQDALGQNGIELRRAKGGVYSKFRYLQIDNFAISP
jgi:hypothetical protein